MAFVSRVVLALLSVALFMSVTTKSAFAAGDELPVVPRSASPSASEPAAVSPEFVAVAAGAGTSFVSLIAGSMIIARSDVREVRNAALLGAQGGMVLSPIIAHAIVGETKRGLLFATIPLFAEALSATMIAVQPGVLEKAPAGIQWLTFTGVTIAVLGSTFGVIDAANASERAAESKRLGFLQRINVSASFDRNLTFATIGGSL